ncbi:D-tagatose-bisphosphate aldolase, class II, non-catalytic subunit [Pseudoalteromonas carrageenovora]|uniref:D-tagatose-bisphosphate aldolase, class II, non-catalytic subunit n=1 Tax=Pseudoalteromonas TaxID=53246 RepID=UPI000AE523AB|nr:MULTISPECIES: D-tagatose-bisphosphate aldolase, class II, non-catalytic subunit [Pseudoalteromonas]MDO6634583.1 D-tagatose-bisphosphate aldolase, class II, non-catalytic subunit [Pseudoalteromonas carrageenovora]MDO6648058.1 D-tagatose-bisphosphate aldolase, class II, non-catalytic subunit [Pseudoalteromonas carrageenovora]
MTTDFLKEIVQQNRAGGSRGIYSVCSAHRLVIEASMQQAKSDGSPLLVEATCNQVNHEGGYTGMTPSDFCKYVLDIAKEVGFSQEQLILGGDHLGPNPWTDLPAAQAMEAAKKMVADYVSAGFSKIHLDASMACADDVEPLADEVIAQRATILCAAGEAAVSDKNAAPMYIIGTEVPVPGGAQEDLHELATTNIDDLKQTIKTHKAKFSENGLQDAWDRVIGVVVQPGVEFDHAMVIGYQSEKAQTLSKTILDFDNLVYEAHSTDYQTETALTNLVNDHFAILKVGPGLTYAAREALFALSYIEQEWITNKPLSNLRQVLEERMLENPKNWAKYYTGTEQEQAFARKYSFSDRSRYYWADPIVDQSVQTLINNLTEQPAPMTLLSQFMPLQYAAFRAGQLNNDPLSLIRHWIQEVVSTYARASGLAVK